MSKILYAKSVTNVKVDELLNKSRDLASKGLRPKLQVILVGDNPASQLYVANKEKFCKKIGADFKLIKLASEISRDNFLAKVNEMNQADDVTGCFVQLPIPKHLQDIDITQLINPDKDVDGFHFKNIEKIYMNSDKGMLPCTPKGILTLLRENNIEIEGKNVVIIGRSFIVGKPLSLLLTNRNATVTVCHSKTVGIKEHTKKADIIICAIGVPHFLTKDFLNGDKKQILIDVGINKLDGKTVGDIHFEDVKDQCAAITPVPGGVGPMTIFSLMENLIESTQNILNQRK